MKNNLEFTQLLNTKFQHDISGAISAIQNTLELSGETSDEKPRSGATQLVLESAAFLSSAVKFYRYLYSSYMDTSMQISVLQTLITDFFASTKKHVKINFVTSLKNIDFVLGQMVVGVLALLHSNIKKQEIKVSLLEETLEINVINCAYKPDSQFVQILHGDVTKKKLTIYNVNQYYLYLLAKKHDYRLNVSYFEDTLIFQITKG